MHTFRHPQDDGTVLLLVEHDGIVEEWWCDGTDRVLVASCPAPIPSPA